MHTPSRRTWRIRRSGVYPKPILSPKHARNVAAAAAAPLHAAVMLAAGAVFLSCCHRVRATGSGLARPSISEWFGVRRIDGLLTQKLYRNGCMGGGKGFVTLRRPAHTGVEASVDIDHPPQHHSLLPRGRRHLAVDTCRPAQHGS